MQLWQFSLPLWLSCQFGRTTSPAQHPR